MERFEFRRRLGMRDHSVTYLAYDLMWKEKVVLKLLYWPESFMSLALQCCNQNLPFHPALVVTQGVVPLTSACYVPEGTPFRPTFAVIYEYCDEGNLNDWMKIHHEDPPAIKMPIFKTIVRGLAHLHRCGLLHGNIKASNVVFRAGVPKLCDRMLLRNNGSQMVCLSPYFAPEIRLEERETFTSASDVFSIGILLVQLFTKPAEFAVWLSRVRQYLPDTKNWASHVRIPSHSYAPDEVMDLIEILLYRSAKNRIYWHDLPPFMNDFKLEPNDH